MKRKRVYFLLLCFFIWQILLTLVIIFGGNVIPFKPRFAFEERDYFIPIFLKSRANFDGVHYLSIAKGGYGVYQQAFFPLYPRLIRLLSNILNGRYLVSALSVSWVAFFLALVFFYKLIILDYEESIAKKTIIMLLLFPTAFFFSMVYTESLFLFLVVASFFFARSKKWFWAGILGALASATSLTGIFLFPALLYEWYQQTKTKKIKASRLIPIFFIPLGLFYYMRFLLINYQDPLMFFHVQPFLEVGRSNGKLILLYQVFWRYLKMLWTVEKMTPTYFVVVSEFLTGLGFFGLLIVSYLKKIRPSYIIFAVFVYLAPTLAGTFSSLPRYALTLFPCFIAIALLAGQNKFLKACYPIVAGILLAVCVILFTRGYWIA